MEQYKTFGEKGLKILHGIHLAQKALFEERAKNDDTIIICDRNGKPVEVKAADYLAQHKSFFDSI